MLEKILTYSLYLFAFLISLQTRLIIIPGSLNGGYSEYQTVSLYASDILLLILLALFSINQFQKKVLPNLKAPTTAYLFLAGLILASFLSIFLAPSLSLAAFKFFIFLLSASLIILIKNIKHNPSYLIYNLISGVLLQSFYSIWQFLAQTSIANKWLGLAAHNPTDLGVSVIETLNGERWLRAYGTLDHPNMLGGFLSIAILLATAHFLNNSEKKSSPQKILFESYLITIFTIGLFFTFSRAGCLGLILGLIYQFIILLKKSNSEQKKYFLKLIALPIFVILFLSINLSSLLTGRIEINNRLEEKSINERIASNTEALKIIKPNFLFGTGLGNYTLNLQKQTNDKQAWYYQPVHNTFLLILAEIGLIGLIFFILILVTTFWKNRFSLNASLLIPIIIIILFDHWLWSLHPGILLFWLIIGIINTKVAY